MSSLVGKLSQETRANKFPKGSRASKGEQHWQVPEAPCGEFLQEKTYNIGKNTWKITVVHQVHL